MTRSLTSLGRHWVALLIVAIGAGTAAAVAAAHHRLFTEALPFVDADRLVTVPGARVTYSAAGSTIDQWVEDAEEFEALGLYQAGPVTMATDQGARQLVASAVGLDFFAVFREQPVWGRTLDRSDRVGIRHVVLGHDVGRHLIGTEPATPPVVRIDGLAYLVVGVMPERFSFPSGSQVWMPFETGSHVTQGRGNTSVIARLAPGVSIGDARQRVGATAGLLYAPLAGFEPVRSFRDEVSRGALPLLRQLMLLCRGVSRASVAVLRFAGVVLELPMNNRASDRLQFTTGTRPA